VWPVEEDEHLLTVLRYVERNPLRAGLVKRAADWLWSSLREWQQPSRWPWLDSGPVPRPANWLEHIHKPHTEAELAALRRSVARNSPSGTASWVEQTAGKLGLESTLQPAGRPRKGAATIEPAGGLFSGEEF
jgi:putative transposase